MLFDSVEFIAPHVIREKILLQEMWTSGLDWGDPLDQSQAIQAKRLFEELTELSDVQVHTFTDASGVRMVQQLTLGIRTIQHLLPWWPPRHEWHHSQLQASS